MEHHWYKLRKNDFRFCKFVTMCELFVKKWSDALWIITKHAEEHDHQVLYIMQID